jgi:hypothetical protein
MPSTTPKDPAAGAGQTSRGALVAELERRIEEIESLDDSVIGRFTGWDWLACIVGSLVLPAIAIWWFAG